jgi:hypothetical protein
MFGQATGGGAPSIGGLDGNGIMRCRAGVWTGITPVHPTAGGYRTIPTDTNWQAELAANVYTEDQDNITFAGRGSTVSDYVLWRSLDGGSVWYDRALPDAYRCVGGWPYNGSVFLVWDRGLASMQWTDDDGVSWNDFTGDFATVGGGAGVVQLVPIWVAA